MMKRIVLLALLSDFNLLQAQKEANIWHFGNGYGLDFSSGVPVAISGSMITQEGCSSYSDEFGNLLFYTNGGGRETGLDFGTIWNRNHASMYDMQGVEGGGYSSAQSSVVFKAPGEDSVYYLFTMDEVEYTTGASAATNTAQPDGRGLSYFTVDMRLNGGLGGVVLADQRVTVPSAEGLCAIRHTNGDDYWVLVHSGGGTAVYSVSSSGVALSSTYTAQGRSIDYIKASPDGTKVFTQFVPVGGQMSAVSDFDPSNGTISNPIYLPNAAGVAEFSPNSRYLYTYNSGAIYQYDLQAGSIPASETLVGDYSVLGAGLAVDMQLAPDGKIYFVIANFSTSIFINSINCPNTASPTLELDLFNYSGSIFTGLPNFPAWLFEDDDDLFVQLGPESLDFCNNTSFTLDALNPGASSYLWSTGETTQQITVNTAGTYSVTVTGVCGTGTDEIVISECVSCISGAGNWK